MSEALQPVESNQQISTWLASAARRIEIPFKRQKFRKNLGEVALGVEVYVMRYARDLAVLEYAIYWPALAERCFEWKNAPVLDCRMRGPANKNGFRADIYLASFGEDRLALEREVVRQGEELFFHVNSPATIWQLVCGNLPSVGPRIGPECVLSGLRQMIVASGLAEENT